MFMPKHYFTIWQYLHTILEPGDIRHGPTDSLARQPHRMADLNTSITKPHYQLRRNLSESTLKYQHH